MAFGSCRSKTLLLGAPERLRIPTTHIVFCSPETFATKLFCKECLSNPYNFGARNLSMNEWFVSVQCMFQCVTFPTHESAWQHLVVTHDVWYTATTLKMFTKRIWFSKIVLAAVFEASPVFTKCTRPLSEHREKGPEKHHLRRSLSDTKTLGFQPPTHMRFCRDLRSPPTKEGHPRFPPNFGRVNNSNFRVQYNQLTV